MQTIRLIARYCVLLLCSAWIALSGLLLPIAFVGHYSNAYLNIFFMDAVAIGLIVWLCAGGDSKPRAPKEIDE